MSDRWSPSRRGFLQKLVAAGVIAAADLGWWAAPFIAPRKAWGAAPVRFIHIEWFFQQRSFQPEHVVAKRRKLPGKPLKQGMI